MGVEDKEGTEEGKGAGDGLASGSGSGSRPGRRPLSTLRARREREKAVRREKCLRFAKKTEKKN